MRRTRTPSLAEADELAPPPKLRGALVCAGGSVCVRKKAGSEDLVVEGALSDDFYRVREILFERFQIA